MGKVNQIPQSYIKTLSESKKKAVEDGVMQTPFRINKSEYVLLRKMLQDERLKLQHLFAAVVDAYMRNDKYVRKIVDDWRQLMVVPQNKKRAEYFRLSKKDKLDILEELSETSDINDADGSEL